MIVQLNSGHFSDTPSFEKEGVLEKDALLVYTGKFTSMDGEVDITDDHIEKLAAEHNGMFAKLKRLATGEVPAKALPPIQLDHSTSAKDTVGRLVGNLVVGDYDDAGQTKKALFGRVRILGKDNVERVKDGRWTHLSIGADFETGKLNELTITPFPAAPNASLLSEAKPVVSEGAEKDKEELMAKLHSDKALWEKAKSAADAAGMTGDHKWAFAQWWYKEQGGAMSAMAAEPNQESPEKKAEAQMAKKRTSEKDTTKPITAEIPPEAGKIPEVKTPEEQAFTDDLMAMGYLEIAKRIRDGEWKYADVENELEIGDMSKLYAVEEVLGRWERRGMKIKGSKTLGGIKMAKKHMEMDDQEKKEHDERMKKHLVSEKKMSEEDAGKHLSTLSSEEHDKLSAEVDEHEKKMAAEKPEEKKEEEKKLARMAAKAKVDKDFDNKKQNAVKLIKGIRETMKATRGDESKVRLSAKLSKLRMDGKITPAEIKTINMDELIALDEKALTAVMSSYEKREPVIHTPIYGTMKAENMAQLAAKMKGVQLEGETVANMPFLASAKKHMSEAAVSKGAPVVGGTTEKFSTEVHIDTSPHEHIDMAVAEYHKMVGEGKHEDAIKGLKEKLMKMWADDKQQEVAGPLSAVGEEQEKRMTALAENFKKLQNQYEDLIKLVAEENGLAESDLK